MKKLLIRLKVCWWIITRKNGHWAIINLDQDNLIKLLKEEDFSCDVTYHGIQPFVFYNMIKGIHDLHDEDDMFLEKIAFQAEAGII